MGKTNYVLTLNFISGPAKGTKKTQKGTTFPNLLRVRSGLVYHKYIKVSDSVRVDKERKTASADYVLITDEVGRQ